MRLAIAAKVSRWKQGGATEAHVKPALHTFLIVGDKHRVPLHYRGFWSLEMVKTMMVVPFYEDQGTYVIFGYKFLDVHTILSPWIFLLGVIN